MKINEVMKATGLTKKAIYYYENEGLIKPQKDPENNYRIYSDEEMRKLIVINILRRLDIPIKSIGDILRDSISIKDVLKDQLIITNQKINVLIQNKRIMNDLITRDLKEGDFTSKTLIDFNRELDRMAISIGHAGKELELIFPGTLGKIFAIFYHGYLDEPLDTDEKLEAWNELIRRLDEIKEIEFPEEIKKIVEDLYTEVDEDRLAHWERVSRRIIDEMTGRQSPPDRSSALLAKEALVGYYANPGNQTRIEGFYKLQNFIINNPEMFTEIDRYIRTISEAHDGSV